MTAVVALPLDPHGHDSMEDGARSPLERLQWITDHVIPSGVSGAAVRVAGAIARHINSDSGWGYPASDTLTRWSGVTNPRRAIRELRERGLIKVFERNGKSNGYALSFPKDQPTGRVTTVQGTLEGGQIGHTTPDNCDTPPRTNRSPKQGIVNKVTEQGGPDGPVASKRYAFEGAVIRLTSEHLEQWQSSYSAIPDLPAVLQSRDDWLASSDPKAIKARQNWFVSTSNDLLRKNEAALKAAESGRSLPALTDEARKIMEDRL